MDPARRINWKDLHARMGGMPITEVPTDAIVELARMYACDTPSTIYAGYHLYDNCGKSWAMTWATLGVA